MNEDDKPVQPDGKPTVSLPAMTDRAILEEVARVGRDTAANVATMRKDVDTLLIDGRGFNLRLAGVEGRIAKLESPSVPPLTSVRVGEVVEERASQMNREQDARIAAMLVEKDAKIAKLEAESATKDDVKQLVEAASKAQTAAIVAAKYATKADLEDATKAQTEAIVEGVKGALTDAGKAIAKTPMGRRIGYALAGLALVAITAATNYLTRQPPTQPTVVQQLAPVTVHADAGADQ